MTRARRASVAASAALLFVGTASVRAQTPSDSIPAGLLDHLRATIVENFVDPQRVARIVAGLDSLRRSGQLDRETRPVMLASVLTREIGRLMDGDQHFRVLAPQFAARTVVSSTGRDAAPPERGRRDTVRTAVPFHVSSPRVEEERRANHFFSRVDSLDGNVLLVVLDGFAIPTEEAYARASDVMRRAATAEAIVFDLRRNGGGVEGLNQFLASHLFAPEPALTLYTRYVRPTDRTTVYPVLSQLLAPRSVSAPVFVVISRGTVSAAENFAYSLQQHGRAVVVGERSQGAGHSAQRFELPGGWAVQVPVARVTHPVSGTGWNGTGVVPDVAVPAPAAMDSAYALALRRVRERNPHRSP